MGCPSDVKIGDNLVFSITTHDPDTGVVTDADAAPAYRVYEDETGTAILTGTMAKLDDENTTGFYSELIACTSANGFEDGKSYTVYIEATVDSDKGAISYGFSAHDHDITDVQDDLDNATDGLGALKTLADAIKAKTDLVGASVAPDQYRVYGNTAYDDTGDNLYITAHLEKNGERVAGVTSGTAKVYNASGVKQGSTLSDDTPDAQGVLSFTQATTPIVHDEAYYIEVAIIYNAVTYTGHVPFSTAD